MTLLGKVFIGLILLFSVVFFTFAVAVNASHVNTKELAAQYEQEAQDAETTNRQLDQLKSNYQQEIAIEQASKRAALAAPQTRFEAAENNLLQLEIQAGELRKELTATAQTNDATQKDLRDAASRNRELRDSINQAKAERDKLFQELVAIRGEIARLQGVYQSLTTRMRSLETSGQ